MTYMLRDRPDGQVEIVLSRPVVVGIFAERDVAQRFVAFLSQDEPDLSEEPSDAGDVEDLGETVIEPLDLAHEAGPKEVTVYAARLAMTGSVSGKSRSKAQLPAVIEKPTATAFLPAVRPALTEAQLDEAFLRLSGGEKLAMVAAAFGVPMAQLRGYWASHCRQVQRHIAEGGQQPCQLCQRSFTPSVSNPDTCARCSHG